MSVTIAFSPYTPFSKPVRFSANHNHTKSDLNTEAASKKLENQFNHLGEVNPSSETLAPFQQQVNGLLKRKKLPDAPQSLLTHNQASQFFFEQNSQDGHLPGRVKHFLTNFVDKNQDGQVTPQELALIYYRADQSLGLSSALALSNRHYLISTAEKAGLPQNECSDLSSAMDSGRFSVSGYPYYNSLDLLGANTSPEGITNKSNQAATNLDQLEGVELSDSQLTKVQHQMLSLFVKTKNMPNLLRLPKFNDAFIGQFKIDSHRKYSNGKQTFRVLPHLELIDPDHEMPWLKRKLIHGALKVANLFSRLKYSKAVHYLSPESYNIKPTDPPAPMLLRLEANINRALESEQGAAIIKTMRNQLLQGGNGTVDDLANFIRPLYQLIHDACELKRPIPFQVLETNRPALGEYDPENKQICFYRVGYRAFSLDAKLSPISLMERLTRTIAHELTHAKQFQDAELDESQWPDNETDRKLLADYRRNIATYTSFGNISMIFGNPRKYDAQPLERDAHYIGQKAKKTVTGYNNQAMREQIDTLKALLKELDKT